MKPAQNPDPHMLLPEMLRTHWGVVSKRDVQLLCVILLLLGAGFALLTLGVMRADNNLTLVFPISLVAVWQIRRFSEHRGARTMSELCRVISGS